MTLQKYVLLILSVICIFEDRVKLSSEEDKPYLSVIGMVKINDGIGRIGPDVVSSMQSEMSLELLPSEPVKEQDLPLSVSKYIRHSITPLGKIIFYCDILWLPHRSPSFRYEQFIPKDRDNHIQIAYSVFESTEIPCEWVQFLNDHFDAVAVPDKFLVDVYKNSGVNIPIYPLAQILDLSIFLNLPLKKEQNYPFVFGNFGTIIDRKNHITLIRAFNKAFGINNKNVQLRLNSRFSSKPTLQSVRSEIKKVKAKNIILTTDWISAFSYTKLLQSIDVLVNLSKGEGFSVQPREAMSLGIPVILTNNMAQRTICESGLVCPVSSTIEEPALYFWKKPYYFGNCFNCTVDDAAKAMLEVYNNYESYLNKGAQAREWARQYDLDQLKLVYKNFLKPTKVILGEENKITAEYLMTTSQKLYEKWQKINN